MDAVEVKIKETINAKIDIPRDAISLFCILLKNCFVDSAIASPFLSSTQSMGSTPSILFISIGVLSSQLDLYYLTYL